MTDTAKTFAKKKLHDIVRVRSNGSRLGFVVGFKEVQTLRPGVVAELGIICIVREIDSKETYESFEAHLQKMKLVPVD